MLNYERDDSNFVKAASDSVERTALIKKLSLARRRVTVIFFLACLLFPVTHALNAGEVGVLVISMTASLIILADIQTKFLKTCEKIESQSSNKYDESS
jgi:hypothetical protein